MLKTILKQRIIGIKYQFRNKFSTLKDLLGENEFVEIENIKLQIEESKNLVEKNQINKNLQEQYQTNQKDKKRNQKLSIGDLKNNHEKFQKTIQMEMQENEKEQQNIIKMLGLKSNQIINSFTESYDHQLIKQQKFQDKLRAKVQMKNKLEKDNNENIIEKDKEVLEDITDLRFSKFGKIMIKQLEEFEKSKQHNEKQINLYMEGEEGVNKFDVPNEYYYEVIEEIEQMKMDLDNYHDQILYPEEYEEEQEDLMQEWRTVKELEENISEKYDTFENPNVIKYYPGSTKGPEPKDDPVAFMEWYDQNMPDEIRAFYEEEALNDQDQSNFVSDPYYLEYKEKMLEENDQLKEDEDLDTIRFGYSKSILENTMSVSEAMDITFGNELMDQENDFHIQNFDDQEKLPMLPEQFPSTLNQFYHYMEKWQLFRQFPKFKSMSIIYQAIQVINQKDDNTIFDPYHPSLQLQSLYTYYTLLPQFVRDNIIVQNAVNCLEFTKHNVSYHDKMKAINFVSTYALEIDDYTKSALEDGLHAEECELNRQENYLLEKWVDQESEELFMAEDDHLYEQAKKVDMDNLLEEYIENDKPEFMKPEGIQETLNHLPFQYYENDDGFWDDYIKYKENLYFKSDVLYSRPYFKH